MNYGYARVWSRDSKFKLPELVNAIVAEGVKPAKVFTDVTNSVTAARKNLQDCLSHLKKGDTLVVPNLYHLGNSTLTLLATVNSLLSDGVHIKAFDGNSDSALWITKALMDAEQEYTDNKNKSVLTKRASGRNGGMPFKLSKDQILLAQSKMKDPSTRISDLYKELGVTKATFYKYLSPSGELRASGIAVVNG